MINLDSKIKIGTYNILFPQPLPPNQFSTKIGYSQDRHGNLYDNIDFRLEIIKKNISKSNLDILCIQEITEYTFKEIDKALSKTYQCKWEAHTFKSHGVGILYKRDKFNQLNAEILPIVFPIYSAEGFLQPITKRRVQMLLDLEDKITKKIFRVISCHLLDPRDLPTKSDHVQQVIDFAEKQPTDYSIDRTVIAGDMNQDQYGDIDTIKPPHPQAYLASAFQPFVLRKYTVDDNLTPSEFDKADYGSTNIFSKNRRIDWIWCKGCKPLHLSIPNMDEGGSDHRLVASRIG